MLPLQAPVLYRGDPQQAHQAGPQDRTQWRTSYGEAAARYSLGLLNQSTNSLQFSQIKYILHTLFVFEIQMLHKIDM